MKAQQEKRDVTDLISVWLNLSATATLKRAESITSVEIVLKASIQGFFEAGGVLAEITSSEKTDGNMAQPEFSHLWVDGSKWVGALQHLAGEKSPTWSLGHFLVAAEITGPARRVGIKRQES